MWIHVTSAIINHDPWYKHHQKHKVVWAKDGALECFLAAISNLPIIAEGGSKHKRGDSGQATATEEEGSHIIQCWPDLLPNEEQLIHRIVFWNAEDSIHIKEKKFQGFYTLFIFKCTGLCLALRHCPRWFFSSDRRPLASQRRWALNGPKNRGCGPAAVWSSVLCLGAGSWAPEWAHPRHLPRDPCTAPSHRDPSA